MVSNRLVLSLAIVATALLATSSADARTHERAKVTAWKEGGKVVGIKLKITLRPTGYKRVRIGLGTPGALLNDQDFRKKAAGVKKGYLLHQFKEIKSGLTAGQPKEVTLSVRYKDAPKLKPGSTVEVVSAWHTGNYWHLHGAQSWIYSQKGDNHKIPAAPAAKKPASKTKKPAARAKKPAAKKPRAKAKKPKATAKKPAPKKPATKAKKPRTRLSKVAGKTAGTKAKAKAKVKARTPRAKAKPKAKRVARKARS